MQKANLKILIGVIVASIILLGLMYKSLKEQTDQLRSLMNEIDKIAPTDIKKILNKDKYKKKYDIERKLPDRIDLANLLNAFSFKTMIEIGVRDAIYANELLQNTGCGFERYYGIDPYEKLTNYIDSSNKEQKDQEEDYVKVSNLLYQKFGKRRISMVRNYSTSVVGLFKKGSIDFIYVDARHDYCGVTEDMNAYYPILKCGGLFAGHDYELKSPSPDQDWGVCGNGSRIEGSVKRAVLEFAERNAIPFIHTTQEVFSKSWYFFKNC
jgi:hypothetical protein